MQYLKNKKFIQSDIAGGLSKLNIGTLNEYIPLVYTYNCKYICLVPLAPPKDPLVWNE